MRSRFADMKNRIREHRKARGWTVEQLAEMVGTSKGHLSDIETGKREASVPMLRAIGQALGISEVEMFPGDDQLLQLMHDFSRLSPEDKLAVVRHAHGLRAATDE